jgi:hypothetical protein
MRLGKRNPDIRENPRVYSGSIKSFVISAFFPEVKPAHEAFQSCTVKASEMNTAASRGVREIRNRKALKGKRISEMRLTVKELD